MLHLRLRAERNTKGKHKDKGDRCIRLALSLPCNTLNAVLVFFIASIRLTSIYCTCISGSSCCAEFDVRMPKVRSCTFWCESVILTAIFLYICA